MTGQKSALLKSSKNTQSRDEVGNALRRSQLLEDGSGPRPMKAGLEDYPLIQLPATSNTITFLMTLVLEPTTWIAHTRDRRDADI